MRYALIKFRVYLVGEETFEVYTDHASLRTAMKSPHLSQRMARWLSFFAEYNFVVHYKPGKNNILADALSRRPDYDPRNSLGHQQANDEDDEDACAMCVASGLNLTNVAPELTLRAEIANAYEYDTTYSKIMDYLRSPSDAKLGEMSHHSSRKSIGIGSTTIYSIDKFDAPRVVIPNDADLRSRIIHEFHDAPIGGHLGREKTFAALSRTFFWPHMYKWVRKWVRTCEICQRVKPSPSSQAPLRPLPIPTQAWSSVSMDFVFGLPPDERGRTGVLVFVDRFSKTVHFVPVSATVTAEESVVHFIYTFFRHHGMPASIVSDRDPLFTSAFWSKLFEIVGTKLKMSTAAHPETDGQTERVNRVVEDVLRSYATSFQNWSSFLPLAEFAINNAEHASTGLIPFSINNARHPRVSALLAVGPPSHPRGSSLGGGEIDCAIPDSGDKSATQPPPSAISSPALAVASANAVTRLQTRKILVTPPDAALPIAAWTKRTLINPSAALPTAQPASSANYTPIPSARPIDTERVEDFGLQRQAIDRYVRDELQAAVDRQKLNADKRGRENMIKFKTEDRVLLPTEGI
ncbi:LOW QUALITY PROTEIN: reverse transcriptase [Phytophthora megakarya]|uniref:Reverse transcriptase n=1 Tax=Phytophthora megakarya TaxID=4795 RepID=A0A225UQ40_9STRA|nr:LOW QUALITY PROTEIN: reverse transcriptase [Phytophthora megakarya]